MIFKKTPLNLYIDLETNEEIEKDDNTVPKKKIDNTVDQKKDSQEIWNIIKRGQLYDFQTYFEMNSDIATKWCFVNSSPIHYAAKLGKLNIVQFLISKGVEVDFLDYYFNSPLMMAAYSGELEIIHYLLAKGANINFTSRLGKTPLSMAVNGNKLEAVKLLLYRGATKNDILHLSSLLGRIDIADYLLSIGTDIDEQDDDGFTPLMWAMNKEMIHFLLINGASTYVVKKTDQSTWELIRRNPLHNNKYYYLAYTQP